MRRVLKFGMVALVATTMSAPSAQAELILQSGLVGGSGDVDNVIFNACGLGSSSGTTVQGCLNTNNATLVNFTSNETLNIGGGGQAMITAADGRFNTISIALADPSLGFGKLQFNLDAVADGTATFEAVDQFGTTFVFADIVLDGRGQNFFTLGSLDGQVATNFRLVSTVGIQNITDLEQVRLGPTAIGGSGNPPGTVDVPEPASLALLGLGLTAIGLVRHRRTKQA